VVCAGEQGKWTEMRSLLFSSLKNEPDSSSDLNSLITKIGLNSKNFQTCLTKEEKSEKIEQTDKKILAANLDGVPTMFIGSQMIVGARPYNNYIDSNGDEVLGLKEIVQTILNR
jgi:predicted DsbA family dithiol-disulfide isomerase